MAKWKKTKDKNIDLQNTTQKSTDPATRTPLKTKNREWTRVLRKGKQRLLLLFCFSLFLCQQCLTKANSPLIRYYNIHCELKIKLEKKCITSTLKHPLIIEIYKRGILSSTEQTRHWLWFTVRLSALQPHISHREIICYLPHETRSADLSTVCLWIIIIATQILTQNW
jgi:hypothetical protein